MTGVTPADVVVWAVVAARFLVPLAIPKFPLPGVLASVVMDAVDGSIFEALLGAELPRYQPYDKALDIYSLSVTMLATLRNWHSRPAVQIARALFYYRLVGVLAFELTGWRPLLLLFPNTFEYYFVFYEVVRTGWSPVRLSARAFLWAAAVIWVAIKIPQEYWLHIAQLDVTDVIKARILGEPEASRWAEGVAQLLAALAAVVLAGAVALAVRAVAPPPRRPLRLAADPLPIAIDEAHERAAHVAKHWRVVDRHLLEKIVLVGFLTVIFAEIVPGMRARPEQLVAGVAVIVTFNSFVRMRFARSGRPVESAVMSFLYVAAMNGAFVLAADLLLRRTYGGLLVPAALFFILLLSLIVTMYDRWHPVFDARFRPAPAPAS